MSDFKFGTPYPIYAMPDEYKTGGDYTERLMLYEPNGKCWTFGRWNKDEFAVRPKPFWDMENCNRVTTSRNRQPSHWMPLPPVLEWESDEDEE